jgi:hypothetical protein
MNVRKKLLELASELSEVAACEAKDKNSAIAILAKKATEE